MVLFNKKVLSTITVIFLVVLTFTTGHEGHQQSVQQFNNNDTANNTQKSEVASGDDYTWHNPDDYLNDDYPNDEANPGDVINSPKPEDLNKTKTSVAPPTSTTINGTVAENENSSQRSTVTNETSSPSTQSESSASKINDSQSTPASTTEVKPNNDTYSPSSSTEISSTPEEGNVNITPTTKRSPSPVITQELGDVSDYTAIYEPEDDGIASAGLRTWAVVIFSILISFAAIFTILFFIRGELIRRRKADQRRLLRGSISSEGYFYGDGEGNTSGKYEL